MKYEKKYHNKVFKITDEIYNFPLTITIGDYEYYSKMMKRKKIDIGKQTNFGGESWVNEKHGSYIWLPKNDWSSTYYGVLCHELLHVVFRVMQIIGFKFNYKNTEPINYYFEYLLQKTLAKLAKGLH